MVIKAFECNLKENREIEIGNRLMLSAEGYKRAVDEVMQRYPTKNVLIEKYTKPAGAEMKVRVYGKEVKVGLKAPKERKVYGENKIFIRNDKTVWRVKELGRRIIIDHERLVEESYFVKGELMPHFYDNIGKSWIAKI